MPLTMLAIASDSASWALFLPFAVSTSDLIRKVQEALEVDHPNGLEEAGIRIPTRAWVEFQFAPANTGKRASLQYSGKLQIKHKVQVRTLRQSHVDSHYYATLFKYMKGVCLELAQTVCGVNPAMVVRFASMDDKAKVFACLPD